MGSAQPSRPPLLSLLPRRACALAERGESWRRRAATPRAIPQHNTTDFGANEAYLHKVAESSTCRWRRRSASSTAQIGFGMERPPPPASPWPSRRRRAGSRLEEGVAEDFAAQPVAPPARRRGPPQLCASAHRGAACPCVPIRAHADACANLAGAAANVIQGSHGEAELHDPEPDVDPQDWRASPQGGAGGTNFCPTPSLWRAFRGDPPAARSTCSGRLDSHTNANFVADHCEIWRSPSGGAGGGSDVRRRIRASREDRPASGAPGEGRREFGALAQGTSVCIWVHEQNPAAQLNTRVGATR